MPLHITLKPISQIPADAIVTQTGISPSAGVPKFLRSSRRRRGNASTIWQRKQPVLVHVSSSSVPVAPTFYTNILELACKKKWERIAIPLISSGFDPAQQRHSSAAVIAAIRAFLLAHDLTVYLVIPDRTLYSPDDGRMRAILLELQENHQPLPVLSEPIDDPEWEIFAMEEPYACAVDDPPSPCRSRTAERPCPRAQSPLPRRTSAAHHLSLEEELSQMDESFSEMLLRKISESGMTDSQCYRKANVDRKLFSKIRSDRLYRPSKATVLAFAVALELSLSETEDMLMKAGFALSHSSKFDIIVAYFIRREIYDVFQINEALFAFDQSLLGMQ